MSAGVVPLSVVVPTRDRPAMLAELLQSLLADLSAADEVVVADSASGGPCSRSTADAHGVRYVRCTRPGASRARNAGWRAATHEVVAFVDDDCVVAPGWSAAVRAAMTDPDVGFVTGRVEAPPDVELADGPVALVQGATARAVDRDSTGTVGSSNNLAVRREALVRIDGFDERLGPATFFAAAEDLDLIDRLLGAGYRGRYDPVALVWHRQWRGKRARLRIAYHYGKGMGGRLAKLRRVDRERARRLRREALWTNGVRTIVGDARNRYEYGVVLATLRVAGVCTGLVAGRVRL